MRVPLDLYLKSFTHWLRMQDRKQSKATILNKQFQSVFPPTTISFASWQKVQGIFESAPKNLRCKYPFMPDIIIDTNGILKLLANFKTDKASSPDEIKPIVLKELRNDVSPVIQIRFEKSSVQTGQLQKDWTTARVSPLFKKGNKSDPANYKPNSLPCILCEVMEHIVASNLTRHLNDNHTLYELLSIYPAIPLARILCSCAHQKKKSVIE